MVTMTIAHLWVSVHIPDVVHLCQISPLSDKFLGQEE